MNLQEQISKIQGIMGINESLESRRKKMMAFQEFIDSRIKRFKEICETMNSEDDEYISFGACDLIDSLEKISVLDLKKYENDRLTLLVLIKYKNYSHIDEDALINELQYELRNWVGDVRIEVEDSINTFPPEQRNW